MGEAKRKKQAQQPGPWTGTVRTPPAATPAKVRDPDDAFPARLAYAVDVPGEVDEILGTTVLADPVGFMSDHPVPMLLRLHDEGMTLSDLATSIIEVARAGMAESAADPDGDADEWDAERRATVAGHLEAFAGRTCALRPEVDDFLREMGYNWFAFDDDPEADVPGLTDVGTLDRAAAVGGTLAHLARIAADALDVEPYGLQGSFPGFGSLSYEGRDLYAFTPVPGSKLGGGFDMALGGKDGPKIRFAPEGAGADGTVLMRAAPLDDLEDAA